ncbi:uncharacterized protein LOC122248647 [Penaeus japonicus]|uniref:uncharacterized protein LOC122248647 n=1 Tax=Penaeus japonicus TaxID=27405 RepID=UPI001C7128AB|nr:uncharacterized protein LOC122248647 [Penaeus japonicus]
MARSTKGKAAKRIKRGRIPRYAPKFEKQLLSIVKKAQENDALDKITKIVPKEALLEPKVEENAEQKETTMDTNQPEVEVKEEVMSDNGSIKGNGKDNKGGFNKLFSFRKVMKLKIKRKKAIGKKVVKNSTKCVVDISKKRFR